MRRRAIPVHRRDARDSCPQAQTDRPPAGSEFDRNRDASYSPESELESGYVKITFHGAVTVFSRDAPDCIWRPRDTVPLESSMVVLPRILPEAHLGWFSSIFESAVLKIVSDSTWLVEREDSVDVYSERGLHPRWIQKAQKRLQRAQSQEADAGENKA